MKTRASLLLAALVTVLAFTLFSYTVAKEVWQKIDFDTTVKLQDRIPTQFDKYFSYFSLLGSAEIALTATFMLAVFSLLKGRWFAVLGWLTIIPASAAEVFGKLVLYHPGTPVMFHRSVLETHLPSFYIHTNFSYPSGHVTRTFFLLSIFFVLVTASKADRLLKLVLLFTVLGLMGMMAMTRVSLGEHWLSDVIGGGLLGLAAGLFASALILPQKRHA